VDIMTEITKLLRQKEQLVARLNEDTSPEEREQIECLLEQINAALKSLVKAGPGPID
jgi:hypothetical protein